MGSYPIHINGALLEPCARRKTELPCLPSERLWEVLGECVRRAFAVLSFPHPEGGIVTVTYPITFAPN